MRRIAVLLAAVLLMAVPGCAASGTIAKPAVEEGREVFEVQGSCEAALADGGSVLSVTGSCNLMDGTKGAITVLGADGTKLEEHRFTQEGGDIGWDFDVADDWPSVVYGFISFGTQNMDAQPGEVKQEYGSRFENLGGPDVIWDTRGVIAVFQSEEVVIRPEEGAA